MRSAHKSGQLLVYYLNYLLSGEERFKHLRAYRACRYAIDEVLYDLEVYVGFKKRQFYLAHSCLNVGFGELALAFEFSESVFEFFTQALKHKFTFL